LIIFTSELPPNRKREGNSERNPYISLFIILEGIPRVVTVFFLKLIGKIFSFGFAHLEFLQAEKGTGRFKSL